MPIADRSVLLAVWTALSGMDEAMGDRRRSEEDAFAKRSVLPVVIA